MIKKLGLLLGMSVFFASLGAVAAFAQCSAAFGAQNGNIAGFNCVLTGQDANWCYYDCYCSGTTSACEALYALHGLVNV